jgi:hypothetical protein
MPQASVLALRFIGGGELLVAQSAKSLILASVTVHPTIVDASIIGGCLKLTNVGTVSSIAKEDAYQRAVHPDRPVVVDEA